MAITTVPVPGIRLLMQMLRKQDSLRVPQIRVSGSAAQSARDFCIGPTASGDPASTEARFWRRAGGSCRCGGRPARRRKRGALHGMRSPTMHMQGCRRCDVRACGGGARVAAIGIRIAASTLAAKAVAPSGRRWLLPVGPSGRAVTHLVVETAAKHLRVDLTRWPPFCGVYEVTGCRRRLRRRGTLRPCDRVRGVAGVLAETVL
jgi:hypothetical protein